MKQIQIKNFRSFDSTGYIDIKPITILIGKNSAGKSSFLRMFPLLKQSYEVKTKSPILLYSNNYVDFGEYHDIKPSFSTAKDNFELGFKLNSNDVLNSRHSQRRYIKYNKERELIDDIGFEVEYRITFNEDKKNLLHMSNIAIGFLSNNVNISLDHDKQNILSITINDETIFNETDNIKFSESGEFHIDLFKQRPHKVVLLNGEVHSVIKNENISSIIYDLILKFITNYVRIGTHDSTKMDIVSTIYLDDDKSMLNILKEISYPQTWTKKISHWSVNTAEFKKLRNYLILHNLFDAFLGSMENYLKQTFLNIKYIAPLRATAERYYRIQHLAVEEVDPNGKNLPMFLDSLGDTLMRKYQKWTMENFNFRVDISKTSGHYSIKITIDGENEMNLSDMGFGYSQILPILTQIWYSSQVDGRRPKTRTLSKMPQIIAIEQPELHLHPDFQAKLADSIARIIQYTHKIDIDLRLIIETHSDIIVNRLGDCIINKLLIPDDVNIVIFNKENMLPTVIQTSTYDKFGNLTNWPIGFFQPSFI